MAGERSRQVRARRGIGVLLGVETVALGVVAATQDPATRPVTAALGDGARQTLSHVDVSAAVVVVVGLVALGRFVAPRIAPAVDPLLTTPITIFLIAQLNGVQDLGALVGVYALASAGVLFALLQDRVEIAKGHPKLALCLGAAVGIVPWGIVAFQQVGAGAVGRSIPGSVVLVTLVALAFALAEFSASWRRAALVAIALRIAGLSIVAWLVVAAVR